MTKYETLKQPLEISKMKIFWHRTKKSIDTSGLIYNELLQGALYVVMVIFLLSCAMATIPQQTYLTNTSLSGISKVAIVASVNTLEVSYSTNSPSAFGNPEPYSPNFFVLLGLLDASIRSGVDQGHASTIRNRINFRHLEEKTAQSFIQPVEKEDCFRSIVNITDKDMDDRKLSAAGYDAVIRLIVQKISLNRTAGDNVILHVNVHGQMEFFGSGKIVWDREEQVSSPELHSLDYYKENGLKELDTMLEKAGRNLAYDFVYLK
jgi:hypothetical protein